MKFSILISTYNRLPLLRRAVESSLNQTYPCEIVVVDDASSDQTQEYLKSLGHAIVYHRNPINMGHSTTVNTGVAIAKGDWIKLIDDDDYLAAQCLETMAEAIATHPQAVICSCQAIQVNLKGKIIGKNKRKTSHTFVVRQEDIHYKMLLDILPFGTPVQVMFQKDAFLKSGGWESDFDGNCDDFLSWVKMAQYGDAILIDRYLCYRTLWSEACHKQLSLRERWQMNVEIKKRIYPFVSAKYQDVLPSLSIIKDYLTIHWCLVGLKHGKFLEVFKLAAQLRFSLQAWFLFLGIYFAKLNVPVFSNLVYKTIEKSDH